MELVARNSRGLTNAMFDELDALKRGESTPQMASAKSRIANTICQVTRLEMDFARFVSDSRASDDENGLRALPMGLDGEKPGKKARS